jgi:DNA mismatch repair protein MutH
MRASILASAGDAMQHARARRARNARVATACAVIVVAAVGSLLFTRRDPPATETRKLARDFETVTDVLSKIDFQRIAATDSGRLDFRVMTDAEVEEALGETGSCVKVVRLSEGIRLVDCSTGQQAVIR